MKLSGFKRINKEDVDKDFHPLVERLGFSLNNFADEVVSAFNSRQISLKDNLNTEYKELEVTLNTNGTPKATTTYKSSLTGKLVGLSVIMVENLTNSTSYPTGAPFVTFSESSGTITIRHITGLIANNKYRIIVLAMGN